MTVGVAMLVTFLSEDDVPLSRWYIIRGIECTFARHTVTISIEIVLFFHVGYPRSMRVRISQNRENNKCPNGSINFIEILNPCFTN